MGFQILKPNRVSVTATERLFLTADKSRLVEEGDPAAAFLFCAPGHEIPIKDAEKYGLLGSTDGETDHEIGETNPDAGETTDDTGKKDKDPAGTKEVTPGETKKRRGKKDKDPAA